MITVSPPKSFTAAKVAPTVVRPPVGMLIPLATFETHPDVGQRIPGGLYTWWGPSLPPEGIEVPGLFRLVPYSEPPPAPRSAIEDSFHTLTSAAASPVRPPMLPKVLANIAFDRCAVDGVIEETPDDHPIFQALKAKAIAGRLTLKGLPPGTLNSDDICLSFNIEWLRMCGLPAATKFEILRPTTKLADMALLDACNRSAARGFSASATVRDTMLSEYLYSEGQRRRAEADKAAAHKHATERVTFDLGEEGLFHVQLKGPTVGHGELGRDRSFPITAEGDALFANPGLPKGRVVLARGAVLRNTGTFTCTRAFRAAAGPLPAEFIERWRADRLVGADEDTEDTDPARPYGRRYRSEEFEGSALTVEGRWAVKQMRAHAARLWSALYSAQSRELSSYLHELITSLPVAYYGAVSWDNGADAIRASLVEMVEVKARRYVMGRNGMRVETASSEAWPSSLPEPHAVEAAMVRQLGNHGSPWVQGECLTEPSPEEAALIRRELDPLLFDHVLEAATAGLNETTSQALYDILHREGLCPSPTPSPELRGRVSGWLESKGYTKIERRGKVAKLLGVGRGYVWVRQVVEADATDNEAVNNNSEVGAA